jgi:multidrug efflux pump subunit AcrB
LGYTLRFRLLVEFAMVIVSTTDLRREVNRVTFLGIVSLIGMIVSHIIVLFDFIEERHAAGDPLREALLDAGILRLRPILITIFATTLALIPLAIHGGPLWQGLCFAQIGGLIVATFCTLLFVPTLHAFVVLDLKAIKWQSIAVQD